MENKYWPKGKRWIIVRYDRRRNRYIIQTEEREFVAETESALVAQAIVEMYSEKRR